MTLFTCKNFCLGLLFGSSILYALFGIFSQNTTEQRCFGDWGWRNPPLKQKNGNGRCEMRFHLKIGNFSLLNWQSFYEGEWNLGKKHGRGKFVSLSGSEYDGQWMNDLRQGRGVFTLQDGTRYEGSWIDDKFTGETNKVTCGTVRHNKYPQRDDSELMLTGSSYTGPVRQGLMNGKGSIRFPLKDSSGAAVVDGTFADGHYAGEGNVVLPNGIIYHVDSFDSAWQVGFYRASGSLSCSSDGCSQHMNLKWNGEELSSDQGVRITSTTQSPNSTSTPMQLFDALNALKWFEFHFSFSKNLVESEIYSFDFVDQQTPELPKKLEL